MPLARNDHPVGALAAYRVPTQRSAIAFTLGARGGIRMTSIPAAVNTASKGGGERAVPIVQQVPQRIGSPVQVHEQVPCLLGRTDATEPDILRMAI